MKLAMMFLVAGMSLSVFFNNCSPVQVTEQESSIVNRLNSGASIFINNDEPYTNSKDVTLILSHNSATQMFITNDPSCQTGGQWQVYTPSRPWTLAQENREVKVYAKFKESEASVESTCYEDGIIHDNIPPVLTLIQPAPAVTNSNSVNIKYLASDAVSGVSGLECKNKNNSSIANCQENLVYTFNSEGPEIVTVQAKDKAGNISVPIVQSFYVDKTPPQVSLNMVPAAITNATQSNFAFSGVDNYSTQVSFECKIDSGNYTACQSNSSFNLTQGNHTFFVRAKDDAGNVSPELNYSWKIDLTAPSVQIISMPSNFSNSGTAQFEFQGTDEGTAISKFECQINNNGYQSCSSPKLFSNLTEGPHKFEVRGYDSVNNVSAPTSYSWVIDTTKPIVSITSKPALVTKETSAAFAFNATDALSGIARTECKVNNSTFSNCQNVMTYNNLTVGLNQFSVRAVDKSGNTSDVATYSWTIDQTPPSIQVTSGPAPINNMNSARLVMQVSDNYPGTNTIQCKLDSEIMFGVCPATKDYINLPGGPHTFYARAIDEAGNVSAEVTYSWLSDIQGPAINFTKIPMQKIGITYTATVEYVVTDDFSGVELVSCGLNSALVNCPTTKKTIFSNLPVGNYTYSVTAKDKIGNVSSNSVSWVVEDITKNVNQTIAVNQNNKVDVLVVIDNSGSMGPEQQNMANRFSAFIDQLSGLDWQIGIITTDVSSNAAKKDGRFLEFSGLSGKFIIDSSMNLTSAKNAFAATIQRPYSEGSGYEQGIAASYRAIERSQIVDNQINLPNVAFFRPGSALAIIVVTDANETNSSGTQLRNIPENLVNLVHTTFPGKPFAFHSIIVKSGDINCLNQSGNEGYGTAYEQASALTGGIVGSVCELNYTTQLSSMGKAVVDLIKSVNLQCLPLDTDDDQLPNFSFLLADGTTNPVFTLDGLKLNFTNFLPIGSNQINYTCLK